MDTTTTLRNVVLTPTEKRRLPKLNERMRRYFRRVSTVNWSFDKTGRSYAASCIVHAHSGIYRARGNGERPGEAMDQAFDKVVRQRRRVRAQKVTARQRTGVRTKRRTAAM